MANWLARFKLKKRDKRIAFFMFLVIISITVVAPSYSLTSVTVTQYTPSTFQPVRTFGRSFDVYDGDSGAFIDTIDYNDPIFQFKDDTHKYPKVSIFNSDPYLTNAQGVPLSNMNNLSLTTPMRFVTGNKVVYLHEYYMTVDICARTYTNLPARKSVTSYLNPFVGYTVSNGGSITYGLDTSQTSQLGSRPVGARGALAISQEEYGWESPQVGTPLAAITSSLEDIEFSGVNYLPVDPAKTKDAILARIAESYGNSRVHVIPHVDLVGQSNYTSYQGFTYGVTLPNGTETTVTINTQSAAVGFVDASQTDSRNMWGLVPNIFASENEKVKMPINDPNLPDKKNVDIDQKELLLEVRNVNGWVRRLADAPSVTTNRGGNILQASTSLDHTTINIQLNNPGNFYNLQQHLIMSPSFELEPKSEVFIARANVGWTLWEHQGFPDWAGVEYRDEARIQASKEISWPYGIENTNCYAISKITFKLALVTENRIQMVTTAGRPINVANIVDFDINSIIKNPNDDDVDVSLKIPSFDWMALLSLLFTGLNGIITIIVIIAVIGLIAFVGVKLAPMFRRKTTFRRR